MADAFADALNPIGTVHQGFWTDWSHGHFWGYTWTLHPKVAVVLTNSFTIFVTLCGIQMWTIIRYVLHKRGVTANSKPSTPHVRQQIVLRNAESAFTTARLTAELLWISRKGKSKLPARIYAITLSAALYAAIFAAAGIFSTRAISTASTSGFSTVLLKSDRCGVYNHTVFDMATTHGSDNETTFAMSVQFETKYGTDVQHSLGYAQNCYSTQAISTDTSSICQSLRNATVGLRDPRAGSCPFPSQLCHDTSGTIVLDTGVINSHDDFGINASPPDRLTYQRITTCTVLNGTSYVTRSENSTKSASDSGSSLAYAFYGHNARTKASWTYASSNYAASASNVSSITAIPYQVAGVQAYAPFDQSWSFSDFIPIPELQIAASDVSLFFLTYSGSYLDEIDDPWFSAHQQQSFPNASPALVQRFLPDAVISTVGCTEQHQFCTDSNICTGFLGYDQVQDVESFNQALTPSQNATFDRLTLAVLDSLLMNLVPALSKSSNALLASLKTRIGNSGLPLTQVLPSSQWKQELQHLHSVAMAHLQWTIVRWATGQIAPEPGPGIFLQKPTSSQDIWFCNSLLIPSSFYQSFRVAALAFILGFGLLIIIASLFVEYWDPWKHWKSDDILGLRRRTVMSQQKPSPLPKDEKFCPGFKTSMKTSTCYQGSHTNSKRYSCCTTVRDPGATPQGLGSVLGPMIQPIKDLNASLSVHSFGSVSSNLSGKTLQECDIEKGSGIGLGLRPFTNSQFRR